MVGDRQDGNRERLKDITLHTRHVLDEPILKVLLSRSTLTRTQVETLLIDLVVEDSVGKHIPYNLKAILRTTDRKKSGGVSRGAFNRTLQQARRNITRAIYTMLLLAYLGFFDISIFRPFEEIAARIGGYRTIREILSQKPNLSTEDVESVRTAERAILSLLELVQSPLTLKSDIAKRKNNL